MFTKQKTSFSFLTLFIPFLLLIVSACSSESRPIKGFVLPPGDIEQGKQVFIDYNCHSCHSIPEMDFPEVELESPFVLPIGGEVYRVKNYGELMTAIVNPDHIISSKYKAMLMGADRKVEVSPMPAYIEEMTVAELTDLVEFLHAQYTKLQPQYYRGYHLTN